MQQSNIPAKFPQPFAAIGTKNTIPATSQIGIVNGAASLPDGFPPLTFLPVAAGGVPPFGADMNGILYEISAWAQWIGAGGPVSYDPAFSTSIGGYPKGAWLTSAAGGSWWVSTVDNNVTDPDTGGAGWQAVSFGSVYAGNPNGHAAGVAPSSGGIVNSLLWDTANSVLWICTSTGTATTAVWTELGGGSTWPFWCGTSTGTANAQTLTTPSAMLGLATGSAVAWEIGAGLTNTGATTLTVGTFGTWPIRKDGPTGPIALAGGELVAGNLVSGRFDGTYIHLAATEMGTAALANASSNTGKVAAVSGSIIAGHLAVFSDTLGTVADGGLPGAAGAPTYINSSQTVAPGPYLTDTSAAVFTLTLPATPILGNSCEFIDGPGSWATNNLTINPNGHTIMGTAGNLICNVAGEDFCIWYNGSDWRLQ